MRKRRHAGLRINIVSRRDVVSVAKAENLNIPGEEKHDNIVHFPEFR